MIARIISARAVLVHEIHVIFILMKYLSADRADPSTTTTKKTTRKMNANRNIIMNRSDHLVFVALLGCYLLNCNQNCKEHKKVARTIEKCNKIKIHTHPQSSLIGISLALTRQ